MGRAAEHPAPQRQRHVDLLRAVAILAVVLGHWLMVVVVREDGRLTGYSVLLELDWAHPVTWFFQVMPLFFMVGGFANAASLRSHRARGGDAAGWLLRRSARLVRPTTALLVVLAGGAVLARVLGVPPRLIGTVTAVAVLPLWFLVAYLAVVALTPLMLTLHRRAGLVLPAVLLGLVALGDLGRLGLDDERFAWGNHAFAWLAVHQVGIAWQDGRLPRRRRPAAALSLGGLLALVVLTGPGPYPVSMVTVPGEQVQNASPPTLALMALATTQLGLALLVRDPLERWLRRRPRPWAIVVAVNRAILTIFLWHMPAVVVVGLVLDVAGLLPTATVGSPEWWAWRLPWLAALAVVLAAFVALFAPVERRASAASRSLPRPGGGARRLATAAGYAGAVLGLLAIAAAGPGYHGPFGLSSGGVLTWLAGATVLRLIGSEPRRTSPPPRAAGSRSSPS